MLLTVQGVPARLPLFNGTLAASSGALSVLKSRLLTNQIAETLEPFALPT